MPIRQRLCDQVKDIGYADDDKRAYTNGGGCQSCQGQKDCSGRLELIAAVYGLYEVTGHVRNLYDNGKREFIASEKHFGDHWDCAYKTLRITYRQCGQVVSEIAVDEELAKDYALMAEVFEEEHEGADEHATEMTCDENVEHHGQSSALAQGWGSTEDHDGSNGCASCEYAAKPYGYGAHPYATPPAEHYS